MWNDDLLLGETEMRPVVRTFVFSLTVVACLVFESQTSEAGLFKKLFGCKKAESCEPVCCEAEPVCCEAEPVCCEAEPVCCETPAEVPCCEPAPESAPCCEPAPEPCCSTILPAPVLAPGEKLVWMSPVTTSRVISSDQPTYVPPVAITMRVASAY